MPLLAIAGFWQVGLNFRIATGLRANRKQPPAVGNPKKRLELTVMKPAVEHLKQALAFRERRACGVLNMPVSRHRYRSSRCDEQLREKLLQLAREKPRFGYRRWHILLCRDGEQVNHKRVWRVYRAAGLSVKRKGRKR
jgi:hypothetical protein